jgi:hypothetical protein
MQEKPRFKQVRPSEPIRQRSYSVTRNTSTLKELIENNLSNAPQEQGFDPKKSKLMEMSHLSNRTPTTTYNEYGMKISEKKMNLNQLHTSDPKKNIFLNSRISSHSNIGSENHLHSNVHHSGSERVLVSSNGTIQGAHSKTFTQKSNLINSKIQPSVIKSGISIPSKFSMKTREALPNEITQPREVSGRTLKQESLIDPGRYEVSLLDATNSQPTSLSINQITTSGVGGINHDESQGFYIPKKLISSGVEKNSLRVNKEKISRVQGHPNITNNVRNAYSMKGIKFIDHNFQKKNLMMNSQLKTGASQNQVNNQIPIHESLSKYKQEMSMNRDEYNYQLDGTNSMGNTQTYTIGAYESNGISPRPSEPLLRKLDEEKTLLKNHNQQFEKEIQDHPDHVETFNSLEGFQPAKKKSPLGGFDQYYLEKGNFIKNQNFSTEKLMSLIKNVNSPNMSMEQQMKRNETLTESRRRLIESNKNTSQPPNLGISTIPGTNMKVESNNSKDKDSLYMSSQLLSI